MRLFYCACLGLVACGGETETLSEPLQFGSQGLAGEFGIWEGEKIYPLAIFVHSSDVDQRAIGVELSWYASTDSSGLSHFALTRSGDPPPELTPIPKEFLRALPGSFLDEEGEGVEIDEGEVVGDGRFGGYALRSNPMLIAVGLALEETRFAGCNDIVLRYRLTGFEDGTRQTTGRSGVFGQGFKPNPAGQDHGLPLRSVTVALDGAFDKGLRFDDDGLFEAEFEGDAVPRISFRTVSNGRVRCELVDDDRSPSEGPFLSNGGGRFHLRLDTLSPRSVYEGRCQYLSRYIQPCAERWADHPDEVFATRPDLTMDVDFRLRRVSPD